MGKDPRNAELSAAEFLIIAGRNKLSAATRLEWDKLVKADKKSRVDSNCLELPELPQDVVAVQVNILVSWDVFPNMGTEKSKGKKLR
ncbi:hypothetical protein T01_9531 [Trichinella spiralis]|uniref:Uncharacterized protein n=1 Tax=Trichinella spiralis TaxID=6334 RepID=A0A0V1AR35_TRISP|nr:hypothetical protein T01_9531 [Trichinella spiralis]